MQKNMRQVAEQFIEFLDKSPTAFHAVFNSSELLRSHGFAEVKEADKWRLEPMSKFFFTRNKSAIFAVAVGGEYKPGNGFSIVAAHTDSPCLKVKPNSKATNSEFMQVLVETYGGGLWRTWFDRDLGLAGKVIVRTSTGLLEKLVHIRKPILNLPNLAIHLDRESNDKFAVNKQDHLRPILATTATAGLNKKPSEDKDKKDKEGEEKKEPHHSLLMKLIAEHVQVAPEEIVDFELSLFDVQPPALTGLLEEFVSGPRLDNLVGTYTAVRGLIESCTEDDGQSLKNDPNIRIVMCFDNEECGSQSAQGADASLAEWVLRRLSASSGNSTAFEEAVPRSFVISADQGHAMHPNYAGKYDDANSPHFHKGVILKSNANQRYASTAATRSVIKEIAKVADIPLQNYCVRNDSLCGSTVGPMLSANLGIRCVDVGTPTLAMHSIRELTCVSGIWQAMKLYSMFFKKLPEVIANFQSG